MSILNSWCFGARGFGLIVVDTECVPMPGATRVPVSKVYTMAHLHAVIAGRGSAQFLHSISGGLGLCSPTFDAAAANMPEYLEALTKHTGVAAYELILMGWSTANCRVEGHAFTCRAGAEPMGGLVTDGLVGCAPHDASLDQALVEGSRTREGMIALAEAQCRLIREKAPETSAGGQLIVARVSQHEIRLSPVHTLSAAVPATAAVAASAAV